MNANVIRKNSRVTLNVHVPAENRESNRAIKIGTNGRVTAVRHSDGCFLVKFDGHAWPQCVGPTQVSLAR
jgi:hypothetical protein